VATAIVVLICFVATIVRSTFGFGESLVAVPLLALVVPIEVAVPVAVLLSVMVALIAVIQDRASILFSSAKWLIAFAILGIPVGLAVLVYVDDFWVRLVLGAIIIAFSTYAITTRPHLAHDHKGWLVACGLLSGVLGGAYGLNGPPLVIYGNLRQWSPQQFRATLQAYFLPASLLGLVGYTVHGLLDATVLRDFGICLPATIPAVFLGRYLNAKLGGRAFYTYVHGGLIAIGATLIACTLLR
jgi:uncharacterized membrane protein YfcA